MMNHYKIRFWGVISHHKSHSADPPTLRTHWELATRRNCNFSMDSYEPRQNSLSSPGSPPKRKHRLFEWGRSLLHCAWFCTYGGTIFIRKGRNERKRRKVKEEKEEERKRKGRREEGQGKKRNERRKRGREKEENNKEEAVPVIQKEERQLILPLACMQLRVKEISDVDTMHNCNYRLWGVAITTVSGALSKHKVSTPYCPTKVVCQSFGRILYDTPPSFAQTSPMHIKHGSAF